MQERRSTKHWRGKLARPQGSRRQSVVSIEQPSHYCSTIILILVPLILVLVRILVPFILVLIFVLVPLIPSHIFGIKFQRSFFKNRQSFFARVLWCCVKNKSSISKPNNFLLRSWTYAHSVRGKPAAIIMVIGIVHLSQNRKKKRSLM